MATWKLSPQYKKSAVEKMFFYKDGKCITIEQGFRWATFNVQSDLRPLTDEELVNEGGYELSFIENDESWEMWDMTDGCWLDIEAARDNTTEEDVAEFEAAWEEDSYEGVEAIGWVNDDTEYYYYGPLELTNEDSGEVFQGEPDEDTVVDTAPAEVVESKETAELPPLPSGVTDWFPVDINPVRNGTYEIMFDQEQSQWPFASNVHSATWDGTNWDKPSVVKWRGLTKDPSQ
jgi:hypothetical protein